MERKQKMSKKNKEKEVITTNRNSSKLMKGINKWTSFYRSNPQRFVKDYLNIKLKTFQEILLWALFHNNYICIIACRGLGKTYIIALFCVCKCILYPGTRICVASGTKSQAINVIKKITEDFCIGHEWGSDLLNNEIKDKSTGINNPSIIFKNGSVIFAVAPNDNARSYRANILIGDEFRMIKKTILDLVLKPFLTTPRTPAFLNKQEYADNPKYVEENSEIYMTSAWYVDHWAYELTKDYAGLMLKENSDYFCCCLPYQLSIKEKLLTKKKVENEMMSSQFDSLKFAMEYECLWQGQADGSFYSYDDIAPQRKNQNALPSLKLVKMKKAKIPDLLANERRVMSVDIALMASKRHDNDASSIQINSALQGSNNNYISNIVYIESFEGKRTDDLALIIMKYYYKYKCTDLVIDATGVGQSVVDLIMKDQVDEETGELYPALNCCNDDAVADRCTVKNAPKVIWVIKANHNKNNEFNVLLREGFKNGKINLLVQEYEAESGILADTIKGFDKLSNDLKNEFKAPYIQTSLLVNELISLEHEIKNGLVKVKEKSGMRKDRFSSLAYNFWVTTQLERKLKPKRNIDNEIFLLARKPKIRRI